MLTTTEYLELLTDLTEIDSRGRLLVPFLDDVLVRAHAADENRRRRAQAETRVIVRKGREVAHAL